MTAALGLVEQAAAAAALAHEALAAGDPEEARAWLGVVEENLGRALAELREARP